MQLQAISTNPTIRAASRPQAPTSSEVGGPNDSFVASAAPAGTETAPVKAANPKELGETQFADSYGRVKHLALMLSSYASGRARTQMLDAYKTLFTRMEPDTKFTIVCGSSRDKADVQRAMQDSNMENPERVQLLEPNVGSLTVWARDMMVPEFLKDAPDKTALLGQTPLHDWHDNDKRVVAKITQANPTILLDSDPTLVTDGGDVMSNTKESFVGNYSATATGERLARQMESDPQLRDRVIADFEARTGRQVVGGEGHIELPRSFVASDEQYMLVDNPNFTPTRAGAGQATMPEVIESEVIQMFQRQFGKPVTIMGKDDPSTKHKEEPATDHMDMGMTPIDDQNMFVGDPSLANRIIASMSAEERAHAEKVLSEAAGEPVSLDVSRNRDNQEDFDAYVKTLEDKGYQVDRMPHLEPGYSRSYISYNNCLMERFEKDGKEVRRVFLPVYDIPKLDNYATGVWQKHGYEVIPMPLGALSQRWGALRCVSNWLDRSPKG